MNLDAEVVSTDILHNFCLTVSVLGSFVKFCKILAVADFADCFLSDWNYLEEFSFC